MKRVKEAVVTWRFERKAAQDGTEEDDDVAVNKVNKFCSASIVIRDYAMQNRTVRLQYLIEVAVCRVKKTNSSKVITKV